MAEIDESVGQSHLATFVISGQVMNRVAGLWTAAFRYGEGAGPAWWRLRRALHCGVWAV
jgi:hypothetical protein